MPPGGYADDEVGYTNIRSLEIVTENVNQKAETFSECQVSNTVCCPTGQAMTPKLLVLVNFSSWCRPRESLPGYRLRKSISSYAALEFGWLGENSRIDRRVKLPRNICKVRLIRLRLLFWYAQPRQPQAR